MIFKEHVPLASLTTFGIGGSARFYIEAQGEAEIAEAIAFARERRLPLFVLGCGSNILVPDTGFGGVVLKIANRDIAIADEDDAVHITADAGALWDDVVDMASAQKIFGIETLAGIPGSVGGAAVQNIGAYGTELSSVFDYADTIERTTGVQRRINLVDAAFVYRGSFFKQHPEIIITRVVLRLSKQAAARLQYPDLARAQVEGVSLTTPAEIAAAVRDIRARKFPNTSGEGTAGSFFKNPIISAALATELTHRFPGLPTYPQEGGGVKVSLAWLLDHALGLKGFARGPVRLYEKQPIIIVARAGARASDVDTFARDIAERVCAVTGINIEREVEILGVQK